MRRSINSAAILAALSLAACGGEVPPPDNGIPPGTVPDPNGGLPTQPTCPTGQGWSAEHDDCVALCGGHICTGSQVCSTEEQCVTPTPPQTDCSRIKRWQKQATCMVSQPGQQTNIVIRSMSGEKCEVVGLRPDDSELFNRVVPANGEPTATVNGVTFMNAENRMRVFNDFNRDGRYEETYYECVF